MAEESEEESGFTLIALGVVGFFVLKMLLQADQPQSSAGELRPFGIHRLPPQGHPRCSTCQFYAWGGSRPQIARFNAGEWHHPACTTLPENAHRLRGVPRYVR